MIQSDDVQRNREAASAAERMKTSHTSEDKIKAQFQCRHLQQGRRQRVLQYRWNTAELQISEFQFDKVPNPQSFLVWKIRFKNLATICSGFPSDAMLWIKEVEMVDSLDAKILAISLRKGFSKLRDARRKDCLCSEQDHPEFPVSRNSQNEDRFLRGRQIAFMIYDFFRVWGQ